MPDSNPPPKQKNKPTIKTSSTPTTSKTAPPPQPPLQLAAKRLERLLGRTNGTTSGSGNGSGNGNGNGSSRTTNANSLIEEANSAPHSNPCKIVKRWIGTSSNAASKASPHDISTAARILLSPTGTSATGRDLLLQLTALLPPTPSPTPPKDGDDETMEENTTPDPPSTVPTAHLVSSSREVEAWLLSLAVRALWKGGRDEDASLLAGKALVLVSTHLEEAMDGNASGGGSKSALYPLLARLYRYRSLAVERCAGADGGGGVGWGGEGQRAELAYAHRMAVLRRDVDTQATLLNLMLRDLLNASQGEFKDLWLAFCFTFYCFTHFALANGTHAQKHYSHLCD